MGSRQKGYERQLGEAAATQAGIAKEQWQLYSPNIEYTLGQARGQLDQGFGNLPAYVREAFAGMEGQTRQDYARAGIASNQRLEQMWKQQGMSGAISPTAKAALQQRGQLSLAQAENDALQNLRMQEALTGLQSSMSLLDILRGGSGQAGQMAMQGYANQAGLLQFLMQNAGGNPWGNAAAGAVGGAAAGSAGGWGGAVAGGIAGGLSGYYS